MCVLMNFWVQRSWQRATLGWQRPWVQIPLLRPSKKAGLYALLFYLLLNVVLTHGTQHRKLIPYDSWGGKVTKLKTIDYCFQQVKPNKARRVTSFSLGKAQTHSVLLTILVKFLSKPLEKSPDMKIPSPGNTPLF